MESPLPTAPDLLPAAPAPAVPDHGVARVHCQGQHHRIVLTAGVISFPDHSLVTLEFELALELPALSACAQVLKSCQSFPQGPRRPLPSALQSAALGHHINQAVRDLAHAGLTVHGELRGTHGTLWPGTTHPWETRPLAETDVLYGYDWRIALDLGNPRALARFQQSAGGPRDPHELARVLAAALHPIGPLTIGTSAGPPLSTRETHTCPFRGPEPTSLCPYGGPWPAQME